MFVQIWAIFKLTQFVAHPLLAAALVLSVMLALQARARRFSHPKARARGVAVRIPLRRARDHHALCSRSCCAFLCSTDRQCVPCRGVCGSPCRPSSWAFRFRMRSLLKRTSRRPLGAGVERLRLCPRQSARDAGGGALRVSSCWRIGAVGLFTLLVARASSRATTLASLAT